MKKADMTGLYVFQAANRRQADRWIRRLRKTGHITARRRVPIGKGVRVRDGDYKGDKAYCDVLTDATRIPA